MNIIETQDKKIITYYNMMLRKYDIIIISKYDNKRIIE